MTQPERPRNWQDLTAGFILNNLSDEEWMLWKALCIKDPDLEAEVKSMQQTFNQFADIVPLHAPSQQLLDRIRAMVQYQGAIDSQGPLKVPSVVRQHHRLGQQWMRVGHWLTTLVGLGAIAFLSTQVYTLKTQGQQLKKQLNHHHQQLQNANVQIADINRQLEQSTAQLTAMEAALAQAQQR
ncbi:MAG: hypothetical protein AAGD25_07120 [Cyanobacteria bacterium P01_F01_bin.150]